jgi:hypothetical protein
VLADATYIREAYPLRVLPHLLDCFFNLSHDFIVSLLIFLSSANKVIFNSLFGNLSDAHLVFSR